MGNFISYEYETVTTTYSPLGNFLEKIFTQEGLSNPIILFLTGFIPMILVAFLVIGIIAIAMRNRKGGKTEKQIEQEIAKSVSDVPSFFDGKTIQQIGWKLLTGLITVVSFGFAYPWAMCMMMRWETKHTVINGRRLKFNGRGGQLFGKYLLWGFLTIITIGIFGIWYGVKMKKWQIKHTVFEDDESGVESEFTGGAGGWFGNRFLCGLLTVFTLGIGYAWGRKRIIAWETSHTNIGGTQLLFFGRGGQLFGKYLLWGLLMVVTIGIFGLFVPVKYIKWQAEHTAQAVFVKKAVPSQKKSRIHEALVEQELMPIQLAAKEQEIERLKSTVNEQSTDADLQQAALDGNAYALYVLALREKGESEQFEGRALHHLKQSANEGYGEAMYLYGPYAGSEAACIEWLEKSARTGKENASWRLKEIYLGIAQREHAADEKNGAEALEKAAFWFYMAMKQNHPEALQKTDSYEEMLETVASWKQTEMESFAQPRKSSKGLRVALIIIGSLLLLDFLVLGALAVYYHLRRNNNTIPVEYTGPELVIGQGSQVVNPSVERVVDPKNNLSESFKNNLRTNISILQRSKSTDFAVRITDQLDGMDIASFADHYYTEQGYGVGSNYDGTLLLIYYRPDEDVAEYQYQIYGLMPSSIGSEMENPDDQLTSLINDRRLEDVIRCYFEWYANQIGSSTYVVVLPSNGFSVPIGNLPIQQSFTWDDNTNSETSDEQSEVRSDESTSEMSRNETSSDVGYDTDLQAKASKGLEFELVGDEYVLVGMGSCKDKDLIIPAAYNGKTVTKVQYEFDGGDELETVTFPNTIVSIGDDAFRGCRSLKQISLPDSLREIQMDAFRGCKSLEEITIPKNVSLIESGAFSYCDSLKSITVEKKNKRYKSKGNCLIDTEDHVLMLACDKSKIPEDGSVASFAYWAFKGCKKLKELTIPASVIEIPTGCFSSCTDLNSIIIADENPVFVLSNGCLVDKKQKALIYALQGASIPDDGSITLIGQYTFQGRTFPETVKIPEGVTTIEPYAFHAVKGVKQITLPEGFRGLSMCAFANTTVERIDFPASLEYVGDYSISGCDQLTDVYYAGTIEMLKSVTNGDHVGWLDDDDNTDFVIHCTDGVLTGEIVLW